jgi:hypothetical protein
LPLRAAEKDFLAWTRLPRVGSIFWGINLTASASSVVVLPYYIPLCIEKEGILSAGSQKISAYLAADWPSPAILYMITALNGSLLHLVFYLFNGSIHGMAHFFSFRISSQPEYSMSLYMEQKAHLLPEQPEVTGNRPVCISSCG